MEHEESRLRVGGTDTQTRKAFLRRSAALVAVASLGAAVPGSGAARVFITRKKYSVNLWTWSWITSLPNIKGDPAKAAFERANPNIDLNVKIFAYGDYLTALKTAVPSGTTGDVIAIPTMAEGHAYSPYLQPLDNAIEKAEGPSWKKPYIPGVLDFVRGWHPGGELYGAPVWSSTGGTMWYSQKLFQRFGVGVPKTYGDIKAFAPAMKKAGIAPIAWGAKDMWPNSDYVIVLASQFKPGVVAAAEAGKTSFTDSAIVKALAFMRQTVLDNVYNDSPFATTAFPDSYINQFGGFKAAMTIAGAWFFNVALTIPGAVADWRAFLFPHIPGAPASSWLGKLPSGSPAGTGASPSRPWRTVNLAYSIPKKTTGDKAKAALEFVTFQASRQGQQLNAGWISPSRTDVHLHHVNAGFSKMLDWHSSLFKYGERRDFLYAEVQTALENAVADVCVNGTDPKSALAQVDAVAKRARGG